MQWKATGIDPLIYRNPMEQQTQLQEWSEFDCEEVIPIQQQKALQLKSEQPSQSPYPYG